MRNQINQGLTVISAKEQMELDISTYKRERNLAINKAVQLLASDTIDRTADMIDFLSDTDDIQYEYRLAAAYETLGSIGKAEAVLTGIANMTLTENEIQAHSDYMNFRQLTQAWEAENKNLLALTEGDIEILQTYTERANTTAGEANALLRLNGIDSYKEPVYFPDEVEPELRLIQYTEEEEEEVTEDRLLLYPNPANEYLIVEYAIKGTAEASKLTITSINGQVVYQENIDYPQDEIVVITNKLLSGQYFCILSNAKEIIKTEKFILAK